MTFCFFIVWKPFYMLNIYDLLYNRVRKLIYLDFGYGGCITSFTIEWQQNQNAWWYFDLFVNYSCINTEIILI